MKYTAINIGPIGATFAIARKPREFWLASYMFSHLMKCLINSIPIKTEILSPYVFEESCKVGLFPDRAFFKSEGIDTDELIETALHKFASDTKLPVSIVRDYFNIMSVTLDADSDREAIKKLNEYLNYLELSNRPCTSITSDQILAFLMKTYDSPLFNIGRNSRTFDIDTLEDIATCELRNGHNISRKSYHDYICIVQADGDNMGTVVTHLPDGIINNISKKLMNFGKEASDLISDFGGLPIYAGGDDLLFIAPVWGKGSTSIFSLLADIDKKYNNIVDEVNNLKIEIDKDKFICTSMSYGLSITYHKYPLYEAWGIAGDQLFNKAKKKYGDNKNAIAWKIQKHSGSTYESGFSKSNLEFYKSFTDLLAISSKDRLVSAVAHKIRANEGLLSLIVNEDIEYSKIRLKAFFDYIVDIEDKSKEACVYIQQVNELLIQLCQKLKDKEIADISALVSSAYGILRTAKFINGEEEKL